MKCLLLCLYCENKRKILLKNTPKLHFCTEHCPLMWPSELTDGGSSDPQFTRVWDSCFRPFLCRSTAVDQLVPIYYSIYVKTKYYLLDISGPVSYII